MSQESFRSPGFVSSALAVVQHLIPRNRFQARLGDAGAVSQHRAGKVPCGLLTHCHMDGCHQRGCPSGEAPFGAHWCPSLLWDQPHWHQPEARCPGEAMASFESNSSTNYSWREIKRSSLLPGICYIFCSIFSTVCDQEIAIHGVLSMFCCNLPSVRQ